MSPTLKATRRWEKTWAQYIDALKRLDEARRHPDGRVAAAARRSARAARRRVDAFNAA